MKLPTLPFIEKKENTDYYLALVLRNEKASAVIFGESMGKVHIVSHHSEKFIKEIDELTDEELLDTLDRTISSAEEALPPNVETHKTIFGIKESWVEDAKIKKEYLSKLKKISDELTLSPVGFLTISEAITHLLQKEEGAPVSAILVEVGHRALTVSLLRAGKVIETKESKIENSIPASVDMLLKHFTSSEVFPSRLIIFDGASDLTQEFISHMWSKSLPFLHLPQITTLPSDSDAKAVLYGAATQMEFMVDPDIPKALGTKHRGFAFEELKEDEKESDEKSEFGFVKNADVADARGVGDTQGAESAEDIRDTKEESEGTEGSKENDLAIHDNIGKTIEEIPNELEREEEDLVPVSAQGVMALNSARGILGKLFRKRPKIRLPRGRLMLFLSLIVGLLVLFAVFYFFLLKATVVIHVSPKDIAKDAGVTFSTSGQTNVDNKMITSEFPSVSEDGEMSTPATGHKETGDKAKGKVTIFNNNDSPQTISASSTLVSSNGIKFTLDKDVTIASASGDVFSGTQPGKADATVTASTFGTEYNLPSGAKFSVAGSSTIAAKNDSAFSGGTKKEITVVSKDDVNKLLTDLPKSLEGKAKSDFQKQVSGGKDSLQSFANETIDKKDFSKNIGDEASQLTLKATVSFIGVTYSKNDFVNLAKSLLKSQMKDKTAINENELTIDVKDIATQKNKDVVATLGIQAKLIPNIVTTDIANQISGKSFTNAEDLITSIPQVRSADIVFSPNIPFVPKILPKNASHITILIHNE